jgi:non-structural maintenance of chromosomes element 4
MKSGQGAFDIDDFVSKLITFMGGRKPLDERLPDESDVEEVDDGDAPLDWEKIGRKALAKSRRVPVMDFMSGYCLFSPDWHDFLCIFRRLGPLSIEQKKRAQVRRAKLEKHKEDERKPQEIREEDIARSENETTKNVAQVNTSHHHISATCSDLEHTKSDHKTPRTRRRRHNYVLLHHQPPRLWTVC